MLSMLDHLAILFSTGTFAGNGTSVETDDPAWAYAQFVRQHLLFTVLGILMTDEETVVFGLGDGLFAVNGETTIIGPYADNAPPYLAKYLLESKEALAAREAPVTLPSGGTGLRSKTRQQSNYDLSIHRCLATRDVETILIATDGAVDLYNQPEALIPGKSSRVGALSDLFMRDDLFGDPESGNCSLTGWLRHLNSEVVRIQTGMDQSSLRRAYGLLPDDTTIVAVKMNR